MVWRITDDGNSSSFIEDIGHSTEIIDPSDPFIQQTLLDIVTAARADEQLVLHPQLVWIEALRDFAESVGIGFPVKKELFFGLVEVLKIQSSLFRKVVELEIATKGTGFAGDHLYTSVSMLAEVPLDEDYSRKAQNIWANFTLAVNEAIESEDLPPLMVQSDTFRGTQRTDAIVQSTLSSYFVANGLYLIVMLIF